MPKKAALTARQLRIHKFLDEVQFECPRITCPHCKLNTHFNKDGKTINGKLNFKCRRCLRKIGETNFINLLNKCGFSTDHLYIKEPDFQHIISPTNIEKLTLMEQENNDNITATENIRTEPPVTNQTDEFETQMEKGSMIELTDDDLFYLDEDQENDMSCTNEQQTCTNKPPTIHDNNNHKINTNTHYTQNQHHISFTGITEHSNTSTHDEEHLFDNTTGNSQNYSHQQTSTNEHSNPTHMTNIDSNHIISETKKHVINHNDTHSHNYSIIQNNIHENSKPTQSTHGQNNEQTQNPADNNQRPLNETYEPNYTPDQTNINNSSLIQTTTNINNILFHNNNPSLQKTVTETPNHLLNQSNTSTNYNDEQRHCSSQITNTANGNCHSIHKSAISPNTKEYNDTSRNQNEHHNHYLQLTNFTPKNTGSPQLKHVTILRRGHDNSTELELIRKQQITSQMQISQLRQAQETHLQKMETICASKIAELENNYQTRIMQMETAYGNKICQMETMYAKFLTLAEQLQETIVHFRPKINESIGNRQPDVNETIGNLQPKTDKTLGNPLPTTYINNNSSIPSSPKNKTHNNDPPHSNILKQRSYAHVASSSSSNTNSKPTPFTHQQYIKPNSSNSYHKARTKRRIEETRTDKLTKFRTALEKSAQRQTSTNNENKNGENVQPITNWSNYVRQSYQKVDYRKISEIKFALRSLNINTEHIVDIGWGKRKTLNVIISQEVCESFREFVCKELQWNYVEPHTFITKPSNPNKLFKEKAIEQNAFEFILTQRTLKPKSTETENFIRSSTITVLKEIFQLNDSEIDTIWTRADEHLNQLNEATKQQDTSTNTNPSDDQPSNKN